MKGTLRAVGLNELFYERAVKRKIILTMLAITFCKSQPATLLESFQLPPTRFLFAAVLISSSSETLLSDPGPDFLLEVPTIVLSETAALGRARAYCYFRSMPGGIQLGLVLECTSLCRAAHGTQLIMILPPNPA